MVEIGLAQSLVELSLKIGSQPPDLADHAADRAQRTGQLFRADHDQRDRPPDQQKSPSS